MGPDDPVRGRRDALLTVVVFADFQCPFCKRESAELEELRDEYGRELRLVWKDCPSPAHEWAEPAAELARSVRAARGDEGFWKAHDLLYESQSELGQKLFRTIAEDLGLTWSTVRAEMTAAKYGLVIQSGVSLADRTAITATPTTFINGRKLAGLKSVGAMKEVADEELERAKRLVAKGTPRERLYEQLISGGKQVAPPSDVPK